MTNEEMFREAISLRDANKMSEAVELLENLVARQTDSAGIFLALGHTYSESGDELRASQTFRKASEVAPRSELASLSLFHSLWSQGRTKEALAEARRFMAITQSDDYSAIIQELHDKWVLGAEDDDPESPTDERE